MLKIYEILVIWLGHIKHEHCLSKYCYFLTIGQTDKRGALNNSEIIRNWMQDKIQYEMGPSLYKNIVYNLHTTKYREKTPKIKQLLFQLHCR